MLTCNVSHQHFLMHAYECGPSNTHTHTVNEALMTDTLPMPVMEADALAATIAETCRDEVPAKLHHCIMRPPPARCPCSFRFRHLFCGRNARLRCHSFGLGCNLNLLCMFLGLSRGCLKRLEGCLRLLECLYLLGNTPWACCINMHRSLTTKSSKQGLFRNKRRVHKGFCRM